MPPLEDESSSVTAYNLPPTGSHSPKRMVQIYNDFTASCSDHTACEFKKTLTEKAKCYPWQVQSKEFKAGYAWFEAFAIAALEIPGFLDKEEVEDNQERLRRIKEVIKAVVVGRNKDIDFAFDDAKWVAIVKLPPIKD